MHVNGEVHLISHLTVLNIYSAISNHLRQFELSLVEGKKSKNF